MIAENAPECRKCGHDYRAEHAQKKAVQAASHILFLIILGVALAVLTFAALLPGIIINAIRGRYINSGSNFFKAALTDWQTWFIGLPITALLLLLFNSLGLLQFSDAHQTRISKYQTAGISTLDQPRVARAEAVSSPTGSTAIINPSTQDQHRVERAELVSSPSVSSIPMYASSQDEPRVERAEPVTPTSPQKKSIAEANLVVFGPYDRLPKDITGKGLAGDFVLFGEHAGGGLVIVGAKDDYNISPRTFIVRGRSTGAPSGTILPHSQRQLWHISREAPLIFIGRMPGFGAEYIVQESQP